MNITEIRAARQQAMYDIEKADEAVRMVAHLISGRLEVAGVQGHILSALKKELKNYNMTTHEWKES